MILRPVEAFPNNGANINVDVKNTFTTTIQGSSSIVSAYRVNIYNASTFNRIYTTDKIDLNSNLTAGMTLNMDIPADNNMTNGTDYYWVLRLYQQTPNIFITNTVIQPGSTRTDIVTRLHNNIKLGMYLKIGNEQRQIVAYGSDPINNLGTIFVSPSFSAIPEANTTATIYSDFVDSLQFPFSARSDVVLSIDVPDIIMSRKHVFNMSYIQAENISIKWHRFVVSDIYNNIIDDTGKIYNSNLVYEFDGFLSGESYIIQGFVENINGIVQETDRYIFTISYYMPMLSLKPKGEVNYQDNCIRVEWGNDLFSGGKAFGDYYFEENYPFDNTNSLVINNGYIVYDSISDIRLNTTEEFGVFSDITIDEKTSGKIIELEDDTGGKLYYLELNSNKFNYVKDDITYFISQILSLEKSGRQSTNIREPNVNYMWMDNESWNDNYYWVETPPFTKRYKVVVMSDKIVLKEII